MKRRILALFLVGLFCLVFSVIIALVAYGVDVPLGNPNGSTSPNTTLSTDDEPSVTTTESPEPVYVWPSCGRRSADPFAGPSQSLSSAQPSSSPTPKADILAHDNDHKEDAGSGWTGDSAELVPAIIGGEDANESEYPWVAYFRSVFREEVIWDCGATILNGRFLLTAAQCCLNGFDIATNELKDQ